MRDNSIVKSIKELRLSQRKLQALDSQLKNNLLRALSQSLLEGEKLILRANREDLNNLPGDTTEAFRDRLELHPKRIQDISESLKQVACLPDPVDELVEEKVLSNKLNLKKIRSPLGLIFMIFESRPNVILEVFSLAFKSGNLIVLRGGSDSKRTAHEIYKIISQTLIREGVLFPVFFAIENYERNLVLDLLARKDLIDVVIPRGGEKLISLVQDKAKMPIIKNDRGLCHAYVDEDADLTMAMDIIINGKTQRPGVCNSLETILVHKNCAGGFLPSLYQATQKFSVEWHVDNRSEKILHGKPQIKLATAEDWNTEYLRQIMNCKIVDSLDEALLHIEKYGSKHSEVIITSAIEKARRFQKEVDAAVVYWNASTRFTDGFEFGLGGEIGISTQKLHVRGPVGLYELTTPRWIVDGTGQVR